MPKMLSKYFRIALEGDTTDGREIDRAWLTQMAANYNRDKYAARVWVEHLRSLLPDGEFRAYGDVVSLKTEEVEVDGNKKLALMAQLEPTPELVALNRKRQKLYTSMEVDTNFAKSGEAYLVGLAVTDSPASLGTEMLQFAAQSEANPFAGRKQNPENLFSAACHAELHFEEKSSSASLLERVKAMFKQKEAADTGRDSDVSLAIQEIATEVVALNDRLGRLSATDAEQQISALKAQVEQLSATAKEDAAALAALRSELESTGFKTTKRPPAAGGSNTAVTDC